MSLNAHFELNAQFIICQFVLLKIVDNYIKKR